MIPDNNAFKGRETFEENGKVFYRSYKIDKSGRFRLIINIVSISSNYRQRIAFSLSKKPVFKGKIALNGYPFIQEKKRSNYVIPIESHGKTKIVIDVEVFEGYLRLSNASDFLDDYPELIGKISAQTGRTRETFRGCSYTSGFSAGFLYGNAFWIEQISDDYYRFYYNDHTLDDDFDDLIFDLKIENYP